MTLHATIARAEADYRAGRYAQAATALAAAAASGPPDATALRILGLCRVRLGEVQPAVALLQAALHLAPADPWAQLHLGIGLQAAGRHLEAAALFRSCQTSLPEDPAPAINLATALLAVGDAAGAERAARKATLRAPERPDAHYTLGLVHLAGRQLQQAGEDFAAAVRRAPRFADAWVNLGLVRYRLGNVTGAKAAMQAAVSAAPAHRAAVGNLGALMRLTGESEAAEQLLTDLLRRDPDAAEARVNLAAQLLHEDRTAEALAWLEGPPPTEVRLRQHWQLQQALALLQLGRSADARTLLDAIGEVSAAARPLLLWRRVLLALAEGQPEQAIGLADDLEAAVATADEALPEHRIIACFDLAKFWSQSGSPARAFQCWQHGHDLLRRIQPFSRAAFSAVVDATIARFHRARLQDGPRASNSDPAAVFIVGLPRSGTTLCEQILAAHPAVFGAGERAALGETCTALGGSSENPDAIARIVALDAASLDAAASAYLAQLHALAPAAERVVDKMPGNFRHLGLVALMLPRARIIHCERDPRDIGLSIFTFRFYGAHPYAHDLSDLGWYIGQQRRLMAHWRAVLPNPTLTVRLRDWVEDFPGTLRRVLDFLGLPYDPACERFYEQDRTVRTVSRAQIREKVNARGLGRWHAYAEQLGPLLAALQAAGVAPDAEA
jgi:tetratricopeptide (TPR) repeat protein